MCSAGRRLWRRDVEIHRHGLSIYSRAVDVGKQAVLQVTNLEPIPEVMIQEQ